MDNREFAKILLCEASDLLESAGSNQALLKLKKENGSYDDFYDMLMDTKVLGEKVNRFKKIYENSLKSRKRSKDLMKEHPDNEFFKKSYESSKDSVKYNKKKYEEYLRKARLVANDSKNIASGKINDVKSTYPYLRREVNLTDNYKYDKLNLEKYDRQGRKGKISDARINHKVLRDKIKANQECADLAVLLTEAALLLNDED